MKCRVPEHAGRQRVKKQDFSQDTESQKQRAVGGVCAALGNGEMTFPCGFPQDCVILSQTGILLQDLG